MGKKGIERPGDDMYLESLEFFRELNLFTVILRLFLAMVLGGGLGLERTRKRMPAGFRTYLVVCVGSAMAMMTGQYLKDYMGLEDSSRIAAQVISGIGFLGAGTIVFTNRNQVRGLTTAAGLWTVGAMGIAVGSGFYTGAFVGFIFVFFALRALSNFEQYYFKRSKVLFLYAELTDITNLSNMLQYARTHWMKIHDLEVYNNKHASEKLVSVTLTLTIEDDTPKEEILHQLQGLDGVIHVEEARI
ncbi:MgtC/SapB family protein [Alkalibacter rhizosphaerae]|uniref:MgtC/SapB family protein n=1 Tax=Alkalibacter rhizosphaerae TaxID=2815577 RepID=A0A974XF36_9FIRM|nr:MgtC/SapB family protein [Alkalibacter rhizosphaerae]QSX08697.1 MgtC/SapB family protein [Alkalibacter rhizosphaerae]